MPDALSQSISALVPFHVGDDLSDLVSFMLMHDVVHNLGQSPFPERQCTIALLPGERQPEWRDVGDPMRAGALREIGVLK